MEAPSELSARCIFCESADVYSLPALIAGESWPVCNMCAGAGRALLDEGALQPRPPCLHLVACELEQFAVGYADGGDRLARKWLYRLRRNLARGLFREVCPCETCFQPGEFVVVLDAFDEFGFEVDTTAETMPLLVLSSMPDHAKVPSSSGNWVRASDALKKRKEANHLATKRPPVSDLAAAAVVSERGEWTGRHGERRFGPIHAGHRQKRDEDAKRYWAAFKKFGPGYLDGDYFVTDEDGECHHWPRRDKKGPRK